ncbi:MULTISPECIES: aromatic ring-hydroxylating dioxygenase subunit alpha [unclassified Sphingomonas]|uniref:aromatic ring-hydroxylating dioxygenase subunit alpha n=1 Tax=unclassified Sphingomonas TaxID=196159 RepID=UPI00226AD82E|nr:MULTISPECIES: aromatic ring-hydroxylating dioxygenase subunit alpha [unclassified Sphingomonas]
MDDPTLLRPDPYEGSDAAERQRNWPNNCWWVAAHSSEVTPSPTVRWILGNPLVFYRSSNGEVAALHDRCPHRWAPLSMGTVQGDDVVCIYHGMRFGPNGQCNSVPTQAKTPSAIRVRAYPTHERYGFVWVWTGEMELADPAEIPDLYFLERPEWHVAWGYKHARANYMQLKENVLDLTHFAFLHASSLGITDWDRAPKVETTEKTVIYRQVFEMAPLAPPYAGPANKAVGKPVNRDSWGMYASPAVNFGAVDLHDPAPEPGGLEYFAQRTIHLTTPASLGKTHYYWAMARDHGEPYDLEERRARANVVFGEDIAVVEATRDLVERAADQNEAIEFSVSADRAAIEARRRVAGLIEEERQRPLRDASV